MEEQIKALEAKSAALEAKLASLEEIVMEADSNAANTANAIATLEAKIQDLSAALVKVANVVSATGSSVGKVEKQVDTVPTAAFSVGKKQYKFKNGRFTLRAIALGAVEGKDGNLTGKIVSISAADALKNKDLLEEIVERYPNLVVEA